MDEKPGDTEDHLTCIMFYFNDLASAILLELRKKYNTTTEATCFVSEQVSKNLVYVGWED